MTTLVEAPVAISAASPVAHPDRTAPRLPSTIELGWIRTKLELKALVRDRDTMLWIIAYPLLMFALFASVFSGSPQGLGDGTEITFAQLFLPGMIATGVMLTSFQQLGSWIAAELENGTLKRLRSTPLPAASYFIGKIGQVAITSVLQTILLLVLATVVFDVPMPTTGGAWFTFTWIYLLGVVSGCLMGIAFSSVPRTARSANAILQGLAVLLQFISGVFFLPFTILPEVVQWIASVFPLRWIALGMRSVFLPEAARYFEAGESWYHGVTVAVLAVWIAVSLVLALRTFRWRPRSAG